MSFLDTEKGPQKTYKLGFDVDDVLAQLLSEWVFRYNTLTHDAVCLEDVRDWDVAKALRRMSKDHVYELLNDSEIYQNVEPHIGALDLVRWARAKRNKDGTPTFRVMFITSCIFPSHGDQKFDWLIRNGFFGDVSPKTWKDFYLLRKDYFPVADKSVVDVDFLVDDNVDNCATTMGKGILVSRPHNLGAKLYGNTVFRAYRPEDVMEFLGYQARPPQDTHLCEEECCLPK